IDLVGGRRVEVQDRQAASAGWGDIVERFASRAGLWRQDIALTVTVVGAQECDERAIQRLDQIARCVDQFKVVIGKREGRARCIRRCGNRRWRLGIRWRWRDGGRGGLCWSRRRCGRRRLRRWRGRIRRRLGRRRRRCRGRRWGGSVQRPTTGGNKQQDGDKQSGKTHTDWFHVGEISVLEYHSDTALSTRLPYAKAIAPKPAFKRPRSGAANTGTYGPVTIRACSKRPRKFRPSGAYGRSRPRSGPDARPWRAGRFLPD